MATEAADTTKVGDFLDNIWLLAALTTILTVVWQIWIFYEIWIKA